MLGVISGFASKGGETGRVIIRVKGFAGRREASSLCGRRVVYMLK
jgi:ribosomal protein L35AE/L33A